MKQEVEQVLLLLGKQQGSGSLGSLGSLGLLVKLPLSLLPPRPAATVFAPRPNKQPRQ